jgi:Domain of unknown function (DUF3846)
MRAILVPADPAAPARLLQAPAGDHEQLAWAQGLVGGYVELCRYDPDAAVLVDEDGHQHRRPINQRITRYVREESAAAAQHGPAAMAGYVLVGDALVIGYQYGNPAWLPVPDRYRKLFEAEQEGA